MFANCYIFRNGHTFRFGPTTVLSTAPLGLLNEFVYILCERVDVSNSRTKCTRKSENYGRKVDYRMFFKGDVPACLYLSHL